MSGTGTTLRIEHWWTVSKAGSSPNSTGYVYVKRPS